MKRDLSLFIEDIIENINDVESFSKDLTKNKFEKNKLKQNAIVRSLEIIGEAVKNIPTDFREKYPEVPWKGVAGFRDVISHSYFKVDFNVVWDIIKKELPDLKEKILIIKEELEIKK